MFYKIVNSQKRWSFYETNIYLAFYYETQYLVLSSLLFIIPSIYALYNCIYSISIILLLTCIVSCNYWYKATYSWRRDLDIIFAKISFIIFFLLGIINVKCDMNNLIPYCGIILLFICYNLSNKLHIKKYKYWFIFHVLFHLIMVLELMLIINKISNI
jgi:hypothetical protein